MKILDCTIRDGGHLNNWEFDPLCVKASYYAALRCGIDYFEIGYRTPASVKGRGPFGYCSDEFLMGLLKTSDKCKMTVMIDAGKADETLFTPCTPDQTPVLAVRVASYPFELDRSITLVEALHRKGYEVFLNLMAASEITEDQFGTLRSWKNKDILQAVYFADSFGSFLPSDIPGYITKLRSLGFPRVGFHPHNNLQMAFANTLQAIADGVSHVDASIYGMGRGSGNLPIEVLAGYLEKAGQSRYNPIPYLDVIERFYLDLFSKYDWGYKIKSLLGGLKNVHPYYVDDLFNRRTYTVDEIWNALDVIKEKCPISYSPGKLTEALETRFYTPVTETDAKAVCQEVQEQLGIIPAADAFRVGSFALQNKHRGRKFVVIANGPSIVKYQQEIAKLVAEDRCVTIGVNFLQNTFIPDYHLFLSRKRFLKYAHTVNANSTLLVPSFFGRSVVDENHSGLCVYFDVDTADRPEIPPINGPTQICTSLNVAVSAILLAHQMGASEVLAVGMDGYVDELNKQMVYFYNENDIPDNKETASFRYKKLAEELDRVSRFLQDNTVPFAIVTPTSHKKYYRNVLNIGSVK